MVLKTGEVKVFLGEREIGKKKKGEEKGIQKAKKPERERGVRPTHIKKEGGGRKKNGEGGKEGEVEREGRGGEERNKVQKWGEPKRGREEWGKSKEKVFWLQPRIYCFSFSLHFV